MIVLLRFFAISMIFFRRIMNNIAVNIGESNLNREDK